MLSRVDKQIQSTYFGVMVRVLYRLGRYILYSFLPLWILVSSLAFHIPNAQFQKQYFENRNIYENFTTEVNNIEDVGEFSFEKLVQFSLLQNLISPSFTRDVVEQNIDITTEWLRGESDVWTLYIPSQKVSDTLQEEIDTSIPALANIENIPVCDQGTTDKIRSEGFTEETACLPQSLIDGTESINQVVGSQDIENNFLKTIQPDTSLNTNTDRVLAQTSSLSDQFSDIIIRLRDLFVFFQRSLIAGWVFSISLIVAVFCLGVLAGKSWKKMLRELSFRIGLSSAGAFVSYIIFTGLSLIISSGTSSFLFPSIPGANVIAFINTEALWWLAYQASWLIWATVIGLAIWVITFFIPNLNLFSKRSPSASAPQKRAQPAPSRQHDSLQDSAGIPFDSSFQKEVEDAAANNHDQTVAHRHEEVAPEPFQYVESDNLNTESSVHEISQEGAEQLPSNLEVGDLEEESLEINQLEQQIAELDAEELAKVQELERTFEELHPVESTIEPTTEDIIHPDGQNTQRATSVGSTIEDPQDPETPPTRKIQF